MNRIIWILMTAVLWIGCRPGIPADVIHPDKMKNILYDIHIADGYISTIPSTDSAKKVAAAYYNGIYKKFEIDSVIYNRSMDYYYAHPEDLSKIYKNIVATLSHQTKVFQRIDSLANAKKVNAQILLSQRKDDSSQVNKVYDINMAEKGLYLQRFNDIYSKNAVLFNMIKFKKESQAPVAHQKNLKIKTDTIVTEKQLKLEKPTLPIEARPANIK